MSTIFWPLVARALRRRANGPLDREQLFAAAIEALPQHVFIKDLEGRFLMVNPALANYFGLRSEDLIGKTSDHLPRLPQGQVEISQAADADVLATGRPIRICPLETHDPQHGQRIWNYQKFPLRSASGEIAGIFGLADDITDSVKADEALRASRRLLQNVVDTLPQAMLVKDRQGRFIMANKALADFHGSTPEEIVGRSTRELPTLTVAEADLMRRADEQAMQTQQAVDLPDVPMTRADGRTSPWHVVKYPLKDEHGEVTGVIGMCEDISERKQREAELSRMAAAVEHAGDAVLITDRIGTIEYVNPAFESLTGYARAEAVGQTPSILRSGKHPKAFYQGLWSTLLEGGTWKARYTNRRKDGSLFEADSTNSPIRNAVGEITGFVGVQRDVTERMELEDKLRRAQRLEALGTLAGGVAHDFNNILAPILGYADLLRGALAPNSPQFEYLRLIREAAQRGRDLVAKILLFGRQPEGTGELLHLGRVAEEVLTLLRPTSAGNIGFRTSIAADLKPVLADATQMHQVVMNLCVNAVQAMPQGGELAVNVDTVELRGHLCYVGVPISGRFVRMTVADTGTGIPEEVISRICEPFFTTKEAGQGTGLGLSTVFGIVKKLGGALDVQSRVGQGSIFTVYFPVAGAPAPVPGASPAFETTPPPAGSTRPGS